MHAHLVNFGKGFFTSVKSTANDAKKHALYAACHGLLQRNAGDLQILANLWAEPVTALNCLCRDLAAGPSFLG